MATQKVRLTAYVDPATAELVKETAEALDQTTSSLVGDMVSYGVPMLEVLRDMALGIKAAPDKARASMDALASVLRPMADEVLREIDALDPESPPLSNRGGTFRNV